MGIDIFMSGTVAAAREAAFWRRPAIAISQYRSPVGVDWERTAVKASKAIQHCLADVLPSGSLWNVNLPADEQMLAEMQKRLRSRNAEA